jgi:NAD(P)-dependent dehydrogenase (short-subunit alcohol dehydrogenase family)
VTAARRLEGRVALVTGAASGNGRAIALRYAREGAAVVCADLRPDPLADGFDDAAPTHEAIAAAGGQAAFAGCDVADGDQVAAAVATCVERFGGLDVAVANAGISLRIHDLPDEAFADYERTVAVNQHGVWWTCREAARAMIAGGRGGRIITMASIGGLVGIDSGVDYNMTKHAVVGLTRTLARQLAKHAITVNAICPGYVRTSMNRPIWDTPERLARCQALTPLPRLGEVEDVAGAAFFLASDDAAWVTGVALPVDGGYTAV